MTERGWAWTAGGTLALAAFAQLAGQLMLRAGPERADAGHLVLLVGTSCLLVGSVSLGRLVGPGPGVALGVLSCVVGQCCAGLTLLFDLRVVDLTTSTLVRLDTLDFLGVAGLVTLLVLARERMPGVEAGAAAGLAGLAVPPVGGLIVGSAVAILVGLGLLAVALVGRWDPRVARTPLRWGVALLYAAAALLSWPRALLAALVVVLTLLQQTRREAAPA